jgi:hypothetical protein
VLRKPHEKQPLDRHQSVISKKSAFDQAINRFPADVLNQTAPWTERPVAARQL